MSTPRTPPASRVSAPPAPSGFPLWHEDPVARRYMNAKPVKTQTLKHRTFSAVALYRDRVGGCGAIILVTHDARVLALDYCDRDELEHQWRETLFHYAGVI